MSFHCSATPRLCRSLDNTLIACVTLVVNFQVSKLFALSNTHCCIIIELEVNLSKSSSLEAHKPFVYVYIVFPSNYYFCLIKTCKLSSSLRQRGSKLFF